MDYEFHEAASIFPMMNSEERERLERDIREHGLQEPICLYENKIIDGRNRYLACRAVDVEPRFIPAAVDDPVVYVMSKNLHRRHLTVSQIALVAQRARSYYQEQATRRREDGWKQRGKQGEHNLVAILPQGSHGKSRDVVGKIFGVSGKSVDTARHVLEKGSDELIAAVEKGETSVNTAASVLDRPKEEQMTALKEKNQTKRPAKGTIMPLRMGLQYARMAIAQLEKIAKRDKERAKALDMVSQWIKENR